MNRTPSRTLAALLALLLIPALAACRAEAPAPKGEDGAAKAKVEEPAGPGAPAGDPAAGPAGETGAPPPPPPSPVHALNEYAQACRVAPPEDGTAGSWAALCMGGLLETLRATVGVLQLPQEEVGPILDEAELAVRRLELDPAAPEAPARARRAAEALTTLTRTVLAALGEVSSARLSTLEQAAGRLDAEQPLGEQGTVLRTFFQSADAVLRPQVRDLALEPVAD